MVFVLLLLILALCVGVYFFYQYRALKTKNQLLINQHNKLQGLLYNIPAAWCSWHINEKHVTCSYEFRSILNLDHDANITVDDVIGIFTKNAFSSFHKALQHLYSFGGEFSLQINIDNPVEKELQIYGCVIHIDGNNYINTNNRKKQLVMLSLQDVTKISLEQKKHNKVQQMQAFELEIWNNFSNFVPMAFWARDFQGRISYCNQIYALALETTQARVIVENLELVVSNSKFFPDKFAQLALQSREKQIIRQHTVLAGERRLLEITEVPVHGESIATIGYALDITNLEIVKNELAFVVKAQRDFLNQLSTATAFYNEDGLLEFFNTAYAHTFQLDESWLNTSPSLNEVLDELRRKRTIPEYSDFVTHKNQRMQLFKTIFEPINEILYQPNGKVLRMTITPNLPGGLFYIFEDITDKIALERGYNTLIAVQKETIDHLYEGIIVIGNDYRVRITNPALYKIWQLKDEQNYIGRSLGEILSNSEQLLDGSQDNLLWWEDAQAILNKRQPCSSQFALKNQTQIQYTYVPLPDGSHLFSFVDISDRWKYEQSLQERNKVLEQTDRLKTDFISHVSYELKAPLNTINGFIDILINQYFGTLNERQLDYCHGIHNSAQRLMHLINDMIDLASIEAGKLNLQYQSIHIETFLSSVASLIYNRAHDQGLEVIIENHVTIEHFTGDERRLKHALLNLLSNSIKFTLPGGKITVRAFIDYETPDFICLAVSDTGVGIIEEDKEKIFKLFEHGTGVSSVGLSLPLVKKLIELHNGNVFLISEKGEGTTIICQLPMRNDTKIN